MAAAAAAAAAVVTVVVNVASASVANRLRRRQPCTNEFHGRTLLTT